MGGSFPLLKLACDSYGPSLRGVGKRTRRTARQCYAKMTAGTLGDGDLAAVRLDQLARDGEPEAAALHVAAGRAFHAPAAEEQVEDRLALLHGDAGPRVYDFDDRFAARVSLYGARPHRDRAA